MRNGPKYSKVGEEVPAKPCALMFLRGAIRVKAFLGVLSGVRYLLRHLDAIVSTHFAHFTVPPRERA